MIETDNPIQSIDSAYLIGKHPHSFRSGERAHIRGVVVLKWSGHEPRPCFQIKYVDGVTDYVAICDIGNYEIVGSGKPEAIVEP